MQPQLIHSCFTSFRNTVPLVHNITNFVAMNTAANVLLAAGCSPAMVHAFDEAPEFVHLANALTINIGTLSPEWLASMLATVKVAHESNIPWVLDPVAVGATTYRRQSCEQLLAFKPDIIRGNASEILALAGMGSQSKGPDSGDTVEAAKIAAEHLTQFAKVVIVTGEIDWVTDGLQQWAIQHGAPMMTNVTAIGCALTALIGAFAGANRDHLAAAAISALCYYGQAGEIADTNAKGPGSFYVEFLDALYILDAKTVSKHARVTEHK
ncbi:hydroxyethylthiazole kinase [uncultured Psychrobacter sp.]|uniref:hydroxyethylthiazole kinase n=1 Tax=uncultured Psychrobacter sp. TaxID=259303 RepID=UPI00345982F3